MNRMQKQWYKDKKLIIPICIAIALYLCGFLLIIVSEGPRTVLFKVGMYMGIASGGLLGLTIVIWFLNRHRTDCKPDDSCLRKKAWKALGVRVYSLIVGGVSFYFLIVHSEKMAVLETLPARIAMVLLAVVVGVWVSVGQFVMKKRVLNGLDERQRLIYEKSKMISDSVFAGLWLAGLMGLWGWVGLRTTVPVYVPVLLLLGMGSVADLTHPLIILIQCKKEDDE